MRRTTMTHEQFAFGGREWTIVRAQSGTIIEVYRRVSVAGMTPHGRRVKARGDLRNAITRAADAAANR